MPRERKRMSKIEKVTYDDRELEKKIRRAVESPDKEDLVEACCFPVTDGCCIKKGASS